MKVNNIKLPDNCQGTFDDLYGLEIITLENGYVKARTQVRSQVCQPFGLVHGGVYASMGEALASIGSWHEHAQSGKLAVGIANSSNFLKPISAGSIHAEAKARRRGATLALWDIDFTNDAGDLCAVSRVTIAIRNRNDFEVT